MPPQPATAWTGIRDAASFGPSAPQHHNQMPGNFANGPPPIPDVYKWYWAADLPIGEDCLSLNVFTPSASDTAKRPVMVWLHGGAFANGAGTARGFDGTCLARDGDVVVVTVNHRLNILGHLFLGEAGGERFADAGNAGLLDLVAALEWVRDNIESFGGDPDNVTIFGELGGGAKVAYLMAMPAAKGLFHKAIIQSAGFRAIDPNGAARVAEKVLRKLNIDDANLSQLANVPIDKLLSVMSAVTLSENGNDYFRPSTDGRTLFDRPFHESAPAISADIPLLMGTCEAEATFSMATDMRLFSLPRDQLIAEAGQFVGVDIKQAEQLFTAYEAANHVGDADRHLHAHPQRRSLPHGHDPRCRAAAEAERGSHLQIPFHLEVAGAGRHPWRDAYARDPVRLRHRRSNARDCLQRTGPARGLAAGDGLLGEFCPDRRSQRQRPCALARLLARNARHDVDRSRVPGRVRSTQRGTKVVGEFYR